MALHDPTDTLAYHQSRVLTTQRPMDHLPLENLTKAVWVYQTSTSDKVSPEGEALWFYGMNHGMSLIQKTYDPLEPMSSDDVSFVDAYHKNLVPAAVRAFYYLLLICTREARHNHSLASDIPKLNELFGSPVGAFFSSIKGGEPGIHQKLLTDPPKCTVGQYVKSLQWVFYNSKWSGGFGGKAWGAVTDCLVRFTTGEFSAEMMLDTNWTLAHNNGPIFNKGLFYNMYTPSLVRILDIQRSGQVPEAILYDSGTSQFVKSQLVDHMKWLKTRFGETGEYVDWFVVEALGAVHKYPKEKDAQVKLHDMSELASEAIKAAQAVAQAKAEAAAKKAAHDKMAEEEKMKMLFEVMPGVYIDKINRKAA